MRQSSPFEKAELLGRLAVGEQRVIVQAMTIIQRMTSELRAEHVYAVDANAKRLVGQLLEDETCGK